MWCLQHQQWLRLGIILILSSFALLVVAQESQVALGVNKQGFKDYNLTLIVPLLRDISHIDNILEETHPTPSDFQQSPNDTNLYVWGRFQGSNLKIVVLEEGSYVKTLHAGISSYPAPSRQSLYLLIGECIFEKQAWISLLSNRTVPSHIDEVYLAIIDTKSDLENRYASVHHRIYPKISDREYQDSLRALTINFSSLVNGTFGLEARKAIFTFCADILLLNSMKETKEMKAKLNGRDPQHISYCWSYIMYHAEPLVSEPGMEAFLVGFFLPKSPRVWPSHENVTTSSTTNGTGISYRQAEISSLCFATRYGFEGMVRFLIRHKADINQPCGFSGTLLESSLLHRHNSIVQLLLESGVDPKFHESDHSLVLTALNTAIKQKDHEFVKLLLDHGADANLYIPEIYDQSGLSLEIAVTSNDLDMVKLLFEYGAHISQPGAYSNVFEIAAVYDYDPIFNLLLEYVRDKNLDNKSQLLCPALVALAARGRQELVQQLLLEGASTNCCTPNGSPLARSAGEGYVDVVRTLLDAGATLELEEKDTCNALHVACSHESINNRQGKQDATHRIGKIDSLRLLLETESIDPEHLTMPLLFAASHSLPMVKLLLEHGANINNDGIHMGSGATPLASAILSYQAEIVKFLLEQGAQIREEPIDERHGHVPHLGAAIITGQENVLRLLMNHGADIRSAKDFIEKDGYVIAAREGYGEILKLLIQSGADLNAQCDTTNCPLIIAIKKEHTAIVEVLLDGGADPNRYSQELPTALQFAVGMGSLSMVEAILRHGGDPNLDGGPFGSALVMAAFDALPEKSVKIVGLLLDHGADINYQDKDGMTALTKAMARGCEHSREVAALLLERGASIQLRDKDSLTILEQAAVLGNIWFIKLIIDGPLKSMSSDEKLALGKRAFYLAAERGHKDVLEILLDNGFRLDCTDTSVTCPLRNTVSFGHLEIIKFLLDRATEFRITFNTIETSFRHAMFNYRWDIASLFVERKAIDLSGEIGSKMVSDAIMMQEGEIAAWLIALGAKEPLKHGEL